MMDVLTLIATVFVRVSQFARRPTCRGWSGRQIRSSAASAEIYIGRALISREWSCTFRRNQP